MVAKLKQERPVFSWLRNRDARWVKPVITLKVKNLAFGSGLMRHATVKGLVQQIRKRRLCHGRQGCSSQHV